MTNPKNGTLEGGDGERPKSPRRRPPTIDLEATEIASEATADATESPDADKIPTPDPPSQATLPPPAPAATRVARRWPRFAAAFVAGAGSTALAAAALWFLGVMPLGRVSDEPKLAAKVAALDRRLEELATRPAPPQPSRELETRIAGLEARLSTAAAPDQTLAARIGALEQHLNEARADEAARRATSTGPADRAPAPRDQGQLDALSGRMAALEQRLGDVRSTTASDQAVRLGLATMELRMAVERGSPFPAELAAVSRLVDDPSGLAPLKPVADTGLPTPAALAQALSKLTPAMLKAAGGQKREEGSVLDRLQAGAERLVRIRRIDESAGDDPAAVIARADVKATRGDIAGALAEIDKLPDNVRAAASGWISAVRTRLAALEAARDVSTHALRALGPLAP